MRRHGIWINGMNSIRNGRAMEFSVPIHGEVNPIKEHSSDYISYTELETSRLQRLQ